MFKSIQTTITTMPATTDTLTVNLNFPVTQNKSFVVLEVSHLSGQSSSGAYAGDYLFTPELTTVVSGKYTQLTLRRWYLTPGGIQMNVKWTVVELMNGSVQSGITSITSTSMEVPVSNFVTGKTFSIAYLWSDFSYWAGDFSSQIIKHKVYNNGLDDVIQLEGLNTSGVDIYWQSIYIPESDVQTEDFTCGTVTTFDHTITSAVDLSKTFIIGSILQSGTPHNADHLKGFRMLSTTQIRTFSQTAFASEFVIYVIQHPSVVVKDRGFLSWSTQNASFTLASPVNKDRVFVLLGHQNQHWGCVDFAAEWFGDIGHRSTPQTLSGDDYTQLRLDRGSTSGTSVITYYTVMELLLGGSISKNKCFPAGFNRGQAVGFI